MQLVRLIAAVLALMALPVGAGAQAIAADPDPTPLLVPANAFVTAFNAGQQAFPSNALLEGAAVLDEFPPYRWNGPDAAKVWYGALVGTTPEANATFKAAHQKLTLGAPQFVRITGAQAYLVLPGSLVYTQDGKARAQTGRWTVVETNTPIGWRISAHAWAITKDAPAP